MRRPSLGTAPHSGVTATSALANTTPLPQVTPGPVLPHKATRVVEIHMIDSTTGWIRCEDDSVLYTSDGGLNWTDATPPALLGLSNRRGVVESLFFSSSTAWLVVPSVFASEANTLVSVAFHTGDAGKTWQQGTISTHGGDQDYSYTITAISDQEAWALETGRPGGGVQYAPGKVYHTVDGGKTWTQAQNAPASSQYNYAPAISFANQQTGIITGRSSVSQTLTSTVYLTQNGGASWRKIAVQSPDPVRWKLEALLSPQFLTPTDGVFIASFQSTATQGVEGFSVFSTHDGGQTWTSAPIVNMGQANQLVAPDPDARPLFFDIQHGYVFGNRVGNWQLYVTSDGGQHWSSSPMNLPFLNENNGSTGQVGFPDFSSPTIGWTLYASQSYQTRLYTTVDGGKTWTQVHAHFPSFITPKSAY